MVVKPCLPVPVEPDAGSNHLSHNAHLWGATSIGGSTSGGSCRRVLRLRRSSGPVCGAVLRLLSWRPVRHDLAHSLTVQGIHHELVGGKGFLEAMDPWRFPSQASLQNRIFNGDEFSGPGKGCYDPTCIPLPGMTRS